MHLLAEVAELFEELRIKSVGQPQHVVEYEQSFVENKTYYIVTEFCPQGDLGAFVRRRGTLSDLQGEFFVF